MGGKLASEQVSSVLGRCLGWMDGALQTWDLASDGNVSLKIRNDDKPSVRGRNVGLGLGSYFTAYIQRRNDSNIIPQLTRTKWGNVYLLYAQ